MNIFKNIKKIATRRGLSIEKVAELATQSGIKVSKSTIYDWNKHEPNPNKIKAVADVLGVSVDYILGDYDDIMKNNDNDDNDMEEFYRIDLSRVPESERDTIKQALDKYTRFLLDDMGE